MAEPCGKGGDKDLPLPGSLHLEEGHLLVRPTLCLPACQSETCPSDCRIPFVITCHLVPFLYLLFLRLLCSLKTEGGLSCRGNPLPPPLFCFSTIFLHFNKITIYSVQSFIPLHRSSAREISCLTRILMTKTWLSSEAAGRGPSRASTLLDICVRDQGLTCIHEEPQWTGLNPQPCKICRAKYR